jgi:hypothetical protein
MSDDKDGCVHTGCVAQVTLPYLTYARLARVELGHVYATEGFCRMYITESFAHLLTNTLSEQ